MIPTSYQTSIFRYTETFDTISDTTSSLQAGVSRLQRLRPTFALARSKNPPRGHPCFLLSCMCESIVRFCNRKFMGWTPGTEKGSFSPSSTASSSRNPGCKRCWAGRGSIERRILVEAGCGEAHGRRGGYFSDHPVESPVS